MKKTHVGFQKTLDFYGCNNTLINSCEFIEKTLLEATKLMRLTIVNATIHSFSPIGVSGVIVIQESHIAIHTWPEHNYASIDIFTCNDRYNLENGIAHIQKAFQANHLEEQDLARGSLASINSFKKKKNVL